MMVASSEEVQEVPGCGVVLVVPHLFLRSPATLFRVRKSGRGPRGFHRRLHRIRIRFRSGFVIKPGSC